MVTILATRTPEPRDFPRNRCDNGQAQPVDMNPARRKQLRAGRTLRGRPAMPSTHKKVIVRKMDRDSISGYVAPEFVANGKVELLNTAGNVVSIDLRDIKCVFFVRDFAEPDVTRKTFVTRPRTAGLWVRLRFRDNDILEGLLPNDLMQVSPEGFLISPPDARSNTQRIFVPRAALSQLTVLAVIGGTPAHRRAATADDERQTALFQQ